jgi:hypothetical protein
VHIDYRKKEKNMKRFLQVYIGILTGIFGSMYGCDGCVFSGHTAIIPRSDTVNANRELCGWQEHINDYDVGRTYWSFYFAPEYKRSWNNKQLAQFLLGGSECFAVQGSRVPNRLSNALFADYFGLPADFSSVISFKPHITSLVLDNNFYIGFDSCVPGLYLRVEAPLVHTVWSLDLHECVVTTGTFAFPAGYMAATAVPRDQLAINFSEAITGCWCNKFGQHKPLVFGDMQSPLAYGHMVQRRNLSHFSDIHFVFGYNFCNDDDYHVGLNLRLSAPAGNRPDPNYFFSPIIGNGHHYEAGLGFTSHMLFWSDRDDIDYAGFWLDLNVTHLFADTQLRTYDLRNGPGSRYMLLSKIVPVATSDVQLNLMPITQQYIGKLFPAINKTTLPSKISMNVQVDMVAKISFQHKGVQVDLGYDLWYRSKEKLHGFGCLEQELACKGDAQLYGFVSQASTGFAVNDPLALNATESQATLCAGQGVGNFVPGQQYANKNINSPALASDSAGNPLFQLNQADSTALGIVQQQIAGSFVPVLLTNDDIDILSALNPQALSHKIFASLAHAWEAEKMIFVPFLSVGTEVEWRCGCINSNSAISQWGIWFKGGISY